MMIQLGHSLGLSVIAEGVEDEHHIARLADMGCVDGQGYVYSRPMPMEEIYDLMHTHVTSDRRAMQ